MYKGSVFKYVHGSMYRPYACRSADERTSSKEGTQLFTTAEVPPSLHDWRTEIRQVYCGAMPVDVDAESIFDVVAVTSSQ